MEYEVRRMMVVDGWWLGQAGSHKVYLRTSAISLSDVGDRKTLGEFEQHLM
jgi:hypothetical protein